MNWQAFFEAFALLSVLTVAGILYSAALAWGAKRWGGWVLVVNFGVLLIGTAAFVGMVT